jgi:hypothetical protein
LTVEAIAIESVRFTGNAAALNEARLQTVTSPSEHAKSTATYMFGDINGSQPPHFLKS